MVSWLESSPDNVGDPGRVHTEGRIVRATVEAAREQQQDQQSVEWLASKMVSWYSQRTSK